MSEQKQTENNDYQFIREKVISKKKGRLRRGVLYTCFVLLLAVLFGIVARAAFLAADAPLKKFLGISEPEPIPSPSPAPTAGPTQTPTPTMTPAPTPSSTPVAPTEPSPTPDTPATTLPEPTPEEITATVAPEESALDEYLLAFARIRVIAEEVQKSLLTVHVFENGTDWLDDPYATESLTSGILVDKSKDSLMVLVNLDRIQTASRITAEYGNQQYEAKLWSYDKEYNLAVIRISTEKISETAMEEVKAAAFGESSTLAVGTPVMTLGNPNGYIGSMEFGVVTSRGSISYLTDNSIELFNTDTSCSPDGDGVVVNLKGEVVGIITRTMKDDLNENLCTAMAVTRLKDRIAKMVSGKALRYFGVKGEDIPSAVLEEQGLENGIYVTEVQADSPAFEAGIKTGDIILMLDDNKVFSYSELYDMLDAHEAGDEIRVSVQRTIRMHSEQIEIPVVLAER